MHVIPAIDLRGGRCVRLTQGDYARETVYDKDPADQALEFERAGARRLHVVDLDGAKAGAPQNLDAIARICKTLSIPVQMGGGIRSLETAHEVLALGVDRVIVGTKLVESPELAKSFFDALGERVVAGIDAKDGHAAVHGWLTQSSARASELAAQMETLGARRVIVTDIAQDGMLQGPNLELLREFLERTGLPVIASGGVSRAEDLSALRTLGPRIEGVIVGKAFYEGRLSLAEAFA